MTLRVCIVEDDPDIRDTLRLLFEDAGAIIEEAADGEAALTLLREQAVPRVLLLDRLMPHLDGVGVLRALAEAPDLRQRTAVLLMTALWEPPDAALTELLNRPGDATIFKPFDVFAVFQHVERAWQQLVGAQ